ncbi:MFS transporter [Sphingobium sp. CR2-8]|uniref:MFS transporter n=1 Tax=Sphingobium sp. CR2-8 TaxID=1306534 RepID=UPI002DBBD984|nr:MFS transporter [Sphingobium sp. CR2-8]MEC3909496.1 MFS transporter [Sphingobium sp. CR2-8]
MVEEAETAISHERLRGGSHASLHATGLEAFRTSAAWYALAILCIVAFLSQLDRHITSIIVAPLKKEFAISDTLFGFLHGYGFAITYAIFGIPFGWLVDRKSRRNIILLGLLGWSLLTSLSAFAESYAQLLILRTGVGIGEAVLAPAAYSLIIDFFEPRQRGRATSLYYVAMSIGGGGSVLLGGLLLQVIPSAGLSLGGVGFAPWRLLFLFAGLPGLLACLLMLTVREPRRRGVGSGEVASITDFLDYVWKHKALLIRISAAGTLAATVAFGTAAWVPTLLERRFGLAPSYMAGAIGLVMIAGSIIGTSISGAISDHLTGLKRPDARTRPMLFGFAAMLPASVFALVYAPWLVILLFGAIVFGVALVQSATPLALQEAVPANMRGQIIALQYVILALCGIGLGPTIVGLITDYVFKSSDMLSWSLVSLALPLSLIGFAIGAFGLNTQSYRAIEARQRQHV